MHAYVNFVFSYVFAARPHYRIAKERLPILLIHHFLHFQYVYIEILYKRINYYLIFCKITLSQNANKIQVVATLRMMSKLSLNGNRSLNNLCKLTKLFYSRSDTTSSEIIQTLP